MEKQSSSVVPRTLEVLLEARKIVEEEQSEALTKGLDAAQKWSEKAEYVRQLIDRFSRLHVQRKVFVSYNKRSEQTHFAALREKLLVRKYEVVTGFQSPAEGSSQVLKDVLKRLQECPVYVGILTPEHRIQKSSKSAPASWVLDEKGMALGMEMEVVLFVDKRVHEDFYKKTLPHYTHIVFEPRKYLDMIDAVVAAVDQRFRDVVQRHR